MAVLWFKVLAATRVYVEKLTKENTVRVCVAPLMIPLSTWQMHDYVSISHFDPFSNAPSPKPQMRV